ncbi:MAG: HPr family phosphocarrier protein [Gammaproteobacteria bacterium]|nr:HPr family phosphocarrier protein [Gammaproteobacteria bacterium]
MQQIDIVIPNKLGLHARAAAKFVNLASQFKSEITITRNGQGVNGKSIMGIMMLAAGKGSKLRLSADGADEQSALDSLRALIDNRFGEDE